MNNLEKQMLEILKSLKNDFGVVAVKAEFEAEGTRADELLRLIEIVRKVNLKLGIKIGGCEAVKDLMECKQFGAEYIIAPMVETEYAFKKYVDAKNKIYDTDERDDIEFLVNIETKTSVENIDKIIETNKIYKNNDRVDGLVFGRVDYTLSCGLSREDINNIEITNAIKLVSQKALDNKLSLVVGGGVSLYALPELSKIQEIKLDRFETRKIIFSSEALQIKNQDEGMVKAVNFELLWLKNKKNYYGFIFSEDDKRIKMLESRWKN